MQFHMLADVLILIKLRINCYTIFHLIIELQRNNTISYFHLR